jgi:hypothetical protein
VQRTADRTTGGRQVGDQRGIRIQILQNKMDIRVLFNHPSNQTSADAICRQFLWGKPTVRG